jgi:hypothetical protein
MKQLIIALLLLALLADWKHQRVHVETPKSCCVITSDVPAATGGGSGGSVGNGTATPEGLTLKARVNPPAAIAES